MSEFTLWLIIDHLLYVMSMHHGITALFPIYLVIVCNRNSYQAEPLTKWVIERTGVPVSI